MEFSSEKRHSEQYQENQATFHPSDDLILSDGLLWDVRSHAMIHDFEKHDSCHNGVFHPNGQVMIMDTGIVSYFSRLITRF